MTIEDQKTLLTTIHQSFDAAAKRLPAYEKILPFFKALFSMQEQAIQTTWPESVIISPELLKAKREGEFPLMDRHQAHADEPAALNLLEAILAESEKANPQMSDGAEVIKSLLEGDGDEIERGFDMVMADDQQGLEQLGKQIGIGKEILIFFLYNSLFPSIAQHERQLSQEHAINGDWGKGSCPICGGSPHLSFLAENGQRLLVCHFCRHQWPIKRILCPHCGNNDTESVSYFFVEEEKAYRVYTCDACKTYIKTVDVRELPHAFYPPLENIITTHLDLHATQMGYHSAAPSGLLT